MLARLEVGVVVVVDADPVFDGHRDVGAFGAAHRRADDLAEQLPLVGQRRAAAATGDLGHRAAEVHVDVVGEPLVGDHLHRRVRGGRVDGVELQRARRLVGGERRHVHGDRMPLDEGAGGHHLADVEPADGADAGLLEFAAQRAEGDVRHAGHGCQHHRAGQRDGTDTQGRLPPAQGQRAFGAMQLGCSDPHCPCGLPARVGAAWRPRTCRRPPRAL